MDDAFSSGGASAADFDVRGRASTTNTLGLIAVIMAMLGACSGYVSFVLALPLGLVALHFGRTVLMEEPDEVSEVYARNGMVMGIVAAIYSAMWLLFLVGIFMLYGGLFVFLAAAGNL